MSGVVVAIALICGAEFCSNVIHAERFRTVEACEVFLQRERLLQAQEGKQVVLDDCLLTTESEVRKWKTN